ncbi:hypothetical protein H1D32_18175 [Anaerobacillus sp. CMMVII]|uniref:hypothetical protein n=1 Tax=Anaerobacillus sp. CMMVII TaxID=2755588 RepID=UPI0021B78AA6|nr:hypothetical protein [Anaerobacillus sp. CMMVII]MCT8139461.1 hypothetical protein [Anaerobacillus sp. CMMVII]
MYNFQFSVETTEEKDQQQHLGIFEMTMFDENKQEYGGTDGMGLRTNGEGKHIVVFSLQGIKGEFLHLTLADYPSRIIDEMKIKLTK